MLVHTPTLLQLLAVISLLCAAAVWHEQRRLPSRALRYWAAACVSTAVLAVSNIVLFAIAPTAAVLVPLVFMFGALALMHCSVSRFFGRPANPFVFLPVAIWIALALFRWQGMPIAESYHERRIATCVFEIALGVAIIARLFQGRRPTRTIAALACATGVFTGFYTVRLGFLFFAPAPPEMALADFWLAGSFYVGILFIAASTYLFLTVCREQAETMLREAAEIDSLTGMPNRRTFRARVERRMASDGDAVLAILDLDRFKLVNDTLGHAVGDEVLRQFAAVVRTTAKPNDVPGRLGGEEFAIWLSGETLAGAARRIEATATLFRQKVGQSCELPFEATFSAGLVAAYSNADLDELARRADEALYRAKRAGRDRIEMASATADRRAEGAPVGAAPAL